MDVGFDHVTLAVNDLDGAKRFFALLGFDEDKEVVVSGPEMSEYMGIEGWEADHVTLVLTGAPVRQEIQLLRFHSPPIRVDTASGDLARTGFSRRVLPGVGPRRHRGPAPLGRRPDPQRDHGLPRPPARVLGGARGGRGRAGRMAPALRPVLHGAGGARPGSPARPRAPPDRGPRCHEVGVRRPTRASRRRRAGSPGPLSGRRAS